MEGYKYVVDRNAGKGKPVCGKRECTALRNPRCEMLKKFFWCQGYLETCHTFGCPFVKMVEDK